MSRYDQGKQVFDYYTQQSKHHLSDEIGDVAPEIQRYIVEFVFGEIYARPGLSPGEKTLTAISALATLGSCEAELTANINNALNVAVAPQKILDTLIHLIPYAGLPRTLNTIRVAQRVFADRGITLPRPPASARSHGDPDGE